MHLVLKIIYVLGNFDGIHLGHQELINQARFLKREEKRLSSSEEVKIIMFSFDPHPYEVISGQPIFKILDKITTKNKAKELGVEDLHYCPFNLKVMNMSGSAFLETYVKPLNPWALIVGSDFKFGLGKKQSIIDLEDWCRGYKIKFKSVDLLSDSITKISSSTIRSMLAQGSIDEASQLLGDRYYLEGTVVKGKQLARKLGFPTLNIEFSENLVLKKGVYLTETLFDGKKYQSLSNFGYRPTVDSNDLNKEYREKSFLETHILDKKFNLNLYDKKIRVIFKKFIRPEVKFNSIEDLKYQIDTDIVAANELYH